MSEAEHLNGDAELQEEGEVQEESVIKLPFAFARRFGLMLVPEEDGMVLYHGPEVDPRALLEARRVAGGAVSLKGLSKNIFDMRLTELYQQDSSEAQQLMEDIGKDDDLTSLADELPETEDLLDADDDAPIIRLINALLAESIKLGASDIHVETYERDLVVRFRVDGVLREVLRQQRKISSLLVSRIKVMAKLDIAEKRIPQDGRISLRIGGRAVDVRVSTMPSSRGERVVMRLLDKNQSVLNLKELGMSLAIRKRFSELIRRPHGILLVTGPTGSGKSTTLYAGLTEINTRDRNILTVEDPIEYELEGIGQTQVNTKVDMTFARGLRAILRQDPDVVMLGEIRDLETGQIAVQASLTGHLVLSTLHTNTAAGAVTRLQDMGIEPFLVSSSLLGVLAQRLVRTLCPQCRKPHRPNEMERELLELGNDEDIVIYRPVGCDNCNQSGFKGRTALVELLEVDDRIRQLIHEGRGELEIEKYLRETTPSIRDDGKEKVLAGFTTVEEVLRVTRED